jgi:hypothetical protein
VLNPFGRKAIDQGGKHADWAFNGWWMLSFSGRRERDRHLSSWQAIDQWDRHADWAFNGWWMLSFSRREKRDRHLISEQVIDQGGRHADWAFKWLVDALLF